MHSEGVAEKRASQIGVAGTITLEQAQQGQR
jgi:hypothetical protein